MKSHSRGLKTRESSASQKTGHRGEPGDELRTILSGLSENWSVLEVGRTNIRWSGYRETSLHRMLWGAEVKWDFQSRALKARVTADQNTRSEGSKVFSF